MLRKRRQEEELKRKQLLLVLENESAALLSALAQPSSLKGGASSSTPHLTGNGVWRRWLSQLKCLASTEAADTIALQIRLGLTLLGKYCGCTTPYGCRAVYLRG